MPVHNCRPCPKVEGGQGFFGDCKKALIIKRLTMEERGKCAQNCVTSFMDDPNNQHLNWPSFGSVKNIPNFLATLSLPSHSPFHGSFLFSFILRITHTQTHVHGCCCSDSNSNNSKATFGGGLLFLLRLSCTFDSELRLRCWYCGRSCWNIVLSRHNKAGWN